MKPRLGGAGRLLRLLCDPGWAVVVVAASFLLAVGSGFAESHDYFFHIAGGGSVAFFVWRAVGLVPSLDEKIASRKRPVVALLAAGAVALLWEAAEFVAGGALGTSFQNERGEAFRDFGFSVLGATVFSLAAWALPNPVPGRDEPIK